jgi:isopenicillin N synthase-like dioxygenase
MDTREKAVPLIDISGYLAGDESSERDAAQQVNEALERVGFFTIAGHDVDWLLVEDIYAEARRFHDLPLTTKEQLAADPKRLGYFGLGQG